MKTVFMVIFGVLGGMAQANEDFRILTGDEIQLALNDQSLIYSTAKQKFFASGRTLYESPNESWGYWQVQGNTYCSQWPPRTEWVCYAIAANKDGTAIQFIGEGADITVGRYP